MTDVDLRVLIGALLVVLPAIDVPAAWLLWRGVRQRVRTRGWAPRALRERAWAATGIAVASILIAIIGGAVALRITLPSPFGVLLLFVAILLPSLTSAGWLIRYFRDGFDDEVAS